MRDGNSGSPSYWHNPIITWVVKEEEEAVPGKQACQWEGAVKGIVGCCGSAELCAGIMEQSQVHECCVEGAMITFYGA